MKVISLHPVKTLKATEKLIIAILKRDINAFKATSKQFIHNNDAYFSGCSGMIA
jgi:hypothetical protein